MADEQTNQDVVSEQRVREIVREPGLLDLLLLNGLIATVSSVPTFTPLKFYDQFKFYNGSLYAYDNSSATWLSLGVPLPVTAANGGTGRTSLTAHYVLVGNGTATVVLVNPSTSGFVLTSNGASSDPSFQALSVPNITVTVTAGETLAAGDVVRLYKAVGSRTVDGYQMVNGSVYACRAAADDTTYGGNVIGVCTQSIAYLSTGLVAVAGDASGFTGLTPVSDYYLANHSGASSTTITQTTQDTNLNFSTNGDTVEQLFIPTSSRLESVTIAVGKTGGAFGMNIDIFRGTTSLFNSTVPAPAGAGLTATIMTPGTPLVTYKGELLRILLTSTDPTGVSTHLYYQSTGQPYNQTYAGDGTNTTMQHGGSTVSGASLYFSVKEFTGFGQVATSAGTRAFRIGESSSATDIYLALQKASAIF